MVTRYNITTAKQTNFTRKIQKYSRGGGIGYVGELIQVQSHERIIPSTRGRAANIQEWSSSETPKPLTKKWRLYFPRLFYRSVIPIAVNALTANYKMGKSHIRVYRGVNTRIDTRFTLEEFKVSVVVEPFSANTTGFSWGDIVVVRAPRSRRSRRAK
jgi:hypothetical protein